MSNRIYHVISLSVILGLTGLSGSVNADDDGEAYHRDYIYGAPESPSDAWLVMSGGRIYDNWYATLDQDKPKETHPLWPESNTKKSGGTTWRCKSCHGWDFRGRDGAYASGSYKTGIAGVRAAEGRDPATIAELLRDNEHGYTEDMIDDDALRRVAIFVSMGQYDTTPYINDDKSVNGDADHGRAIFQTTCAACHGFDGTALNFGSSDDPAYVGTEANANPWEVLAKIRHGHPGAEMIGLSAFPMSDSVDVLTYTQALPSN